MRINRKIIFPTVRIRVNITVTISFVSLQVWTIYSVIDPTLCAFYFRPNSTPENVRTYKLHKHKIIFFRTDLKIYPSGICPIKRNVYVRTHIVFRLRTSGWSSFHVYVIFDKYDLCGRYTSYTYVYRVFGQKSNYDRQRLLFLTLRRRLLLLYN